MTVNTSLRFGGDHGRLTMHDVSLSGTGAIFSVAGGTAVAIDGLVTLDGIGWTNAGAVGVAPNGALFVHGGASFTGAAGSSFGGLGSLGVDGGTVTLDAPTVLGAVSV